MNNPIFKLGDKVKIKESSVIGEVVSIIQTEGYQNKYTLKLNPYNTNQFFPSELELIEEPKFKIGDAVRDSKGEGMITDLYYNKEGNVIYKIIWENLNRKPVYWEGHTLTLVQPEPKFKVGDILTWEEKGGKYKVLDIEKVIDTFIYNLKELDIKDKFRIPYRSLGEHSLALYE